MIYWHGGPAGLRIGDRILPPCVTGKDSTDSLFATVEHSPDLPRVARADRVYLTAQMDLAALYAYMAVSGGKHAPGVIYECVPEGSITPDPDWHGPEGLSVECPSARVVRVVPLSRKMEVAVKKYLRKASRGAA